MANLDAFRFILPLALYFAMLPFYASLVSEASGIKVCRVVCAKLIGYLRGRTLKLRGTTELACSRRNLNPWQGAAAGAVY